MNKKELVKALMKQMQNFWYFPSFTNVKTFIQEYEKLTNSEPQAGHAEEAPRYVKNILARLRELPLHDREVWLKAIMDEFEQDFSHAKWREGYEQGKFEGAWVGEQLKDADKIRRELNRPIVPQFVADWIELCKKLTRSLQGAMHYAKGTDVERWLIPSDNQELFARAWLDGYEVEEEKRYTVKVKGNLGQYLGRYYLNNEKLTPQFIRTQKHEGSVFTKAELEETGFDWVFDCEGMEVQEVE